MTRPVIVVLLVAIPPIAGINAQHAGHPSLLPDSTAPWSIGAMAIGVASQARPAALGRTITEGYLTQPMLVGRLQLAGGRLEALGTLNFEGLTLRRGEINPGVYGEGYIDRRHPHTYLHEVMLGVAGSVKGARVSLHGGKGFVPFGTDDPMVRPFVKYPVNHHLAQVLERVQLVASLRAGPAALEVARFNGDEPESAADWPNAGRAFDSWAVRLSTLAPGRIELSASQARVESPEFATGQGLDQHKTSVSARVVRSNGLLRYGMAEWGRTRETNTGGRTVLTFSSMLAEGLVSVRGAAVALRIERTDRPEEDRLADPYRSVRPLLDFNVLGRTRWETATLHVATPPLRRRWVMATPFVEAGWSRPTALARPAALDPRVFYDASQLWIWSAGVRVHSGTMRARFGRYGAARLNRS